MKIPLAKPVFDEEMEQAAIDALRNEHFVIKLLPASDGFTSAVEDAALHEFIYLS